MFSNLVYPIMMGLGCAGAWALMDMGLHHLLVFVFMVVPFLVVVGIFERIDPCVDDWNTSHGDSTLDYGYLLLNFVIVGGVLLAYPYMANLTAQLPWEFIWPVDLPLVLQAIVAGLIIDWGMYWIHRLSHANSFMWRLHSIHHSSERLYFVNGEKRHIIHAFLEGAPGISILLMLGAPVEPVALWFIFLNMHLSFQHGNLNYKVGFLKYVFSVAELHRWHHRKEYSQSQVNYGAVFSFWDLLFGSYLSNPPRYEPSDVGIDESNYPRTFSGQLTYPFKQTT